MFKVALILAVAFIAMAAASHFDGDFDEDYRHPYRHRHHPRRGIFRRGHFGHGRRPFRQGSFGAGGFDSFNADDDRFGAIGGSTHNNLHDSASGKRGSILGSRQHFDSDHDDTNFEDVGGLHKHQAINSDKLVIKDKTTGVNDVDSFHQTRGNSDRDHISSGNDLLLAEGAAGQRRTDLNSGSNFGAIGGSNSDISSNKGFGIGAQGSEF